MVAAYKIGARIGVIGGERGRRIWAPVKILISYMPTRRYVFYNTHGRCHHTYTVNITVLQECSGTTEQGLHLTVKVDNEVGLAWLEGTLAYAFAHSRPNLWDYREAVMDEVLFEMELEAHS